MSSIMGKLPSLISSQTNLSRCVYLESYGNRNILLILKGWGENLVHIHSKIIRSYEILLLDKYLIKTLVPSVKENKKELEKK